LADAVIQPDSATPYAFISYASADRAGHACRGGAADLLRFLSRSAATLPLVTLITYRSDERTRRHPLYALLPQLARDAGAERITLGHLNDDAVRTLVGERYGLPDADAARLAAYLQERAEGNALFIWTRPVNTPSAPSLTPPNHANHSPSLLPVAWSANSTLMRVATTMRRSISTHRSISRTPAKRRTSGR